NLVALQNKYGSEGLQIVGLNVGGPDDLDKVGGFAKQFNIQYPLATPDDDLSDFLLSDDSSIPQTFIFDRQGKLRKRLVGFGETTGEEIDEVVQQALKSASD